MITAEGIRRALQCDDPACGCHKPGALVHCPSHADSNPSLSVSEKNGKILCHCFGGCDQNRVTNALKERGLRPTSNADRPQAQRKSLGEPVEVYDYHDADGNLVFQVCRYHSPIGKTFRQRRPHPKNPGKWIWNLTGVDRVPYRLPEILKAETVYIVEGEKDADALADLGLTATTNPGGAGKWRKEYNLYFQNKKVIVLPDNDQPGRAHAQHLARNLHGVGASIKVVELPSLSPKGDVSDWIEAGGTIEQLKGLVEAAPEFDPATALADPEVKSLAQDDKKSKPPQAELLIKLAADAELFHDFNQKGFATIEVDGHRETWPIRAKGFRSWLLRRYFQATGKAPGAQAMQDALGVLEAKAHFDGPEHEVYVRVAHVDGKIYIDLVNKSWEAVEITPQGWRVVDNPPVKFRRPRGLAPMPEPKPGGNLLDLKPLINCRDEDWPLVGAWIIGSFSPGPYPVMIFQGEQGTAKTTTARILKSLVDPGHTPQRSAPREIRDLMISASNSWCLSFDNLSTLKDWISDGFCRLATGGGLSTRELYSDSDETILDAMRPVILNGIDSLVSRADLADRAILLELPQILDDARCREGDLWSSFEAAQPGVFGAICDALSAALANFHKVKLPRLPRMADFATWIVAAEPVLPWEPGTFLAAYTRNRAAIVEYSLEGDPVAVAVRSFMEHRESWEGTPTKLLDELTDLVGELVSRGKAWPKAANVLSNRLRRASTFLRASGIEVDRAKSGARLISIRKGLQKTVQTVQTVQAKEPCEFTLDDPLDDPKGLDDPNDHLDDPRTIPDDPQKRPSTRKATDDKGVDDLDDVDDKNHSFSQAAAKDAPLVQCGNCRYFSASSDAPGGRGHCSLGQESWNKKSTQFFADVHLCPPFEAKDSIKSLAPRDEAISKVVEAAVQTLNPAENLGEIEL
jgi:5S rRNA maturation endonuclease (ribonuclease M5)